MLFRSLVNIPTLVMDDVLTEKATLDWPVPFALARTFTEAVLLKFRLPEVCIDEPLAYTHTVFAAAVAVPYAVLTADSEATLIELTVVTESERFFAVKTVESNAGAFAFGVTLQV